MQTFFCSADGCDGLRVEHNYRYHCGLNEHCTLMDAYCNSEARKGEHSALCCWCKRCRHCDKE